MKKARGFTLIELLVAISIVALLSSIIIVNLQLALAKARDARRRSDIREIVNALVLYNEKFGNYMDRADSLCGASWNKGSGWFNYENGGAPPYAYPRSIARCLSEGLGGAIIIDPTRGVQSGFGDKRYTYMLDQCNGKIFVFAKLETVPQTVSATDEDRCSGGNWDRNYGMNYYLSFDK
jgi:prepilin-type N-terminal cleavage/methylation domain-containing protein